MRIIGADSEGDRAIWRDRVDSGTGQLAWSPDGQAVAANVRTGGQERWLLISLADGNVSDLSNPPDTWLSEYWPPWGGKAATTP